MKIFSHMVIRNIYILPSECFFLVSRFAIGMYRLSSSQLFGPVESSDVFVFAGKRFPTIMLSKVRGHLITSPPIGNFRNLNFYSTKFCVTIFHKARGGEGGGVGWGLDPRGLIRTGSGKTFTMEGGPAGRSAGWPSRNFPLRCHSGEGLKGKVELCVSIPHGRLHFSNPIFLPHAMFVSGWRSNLGLSQGR